MPLPYIKTLLFFAVLYPGLLVAQLTVKISSIPTDTPTPVEIFIAGNFNGWDPGDNNFKLSSNGDGIYEITFIPTTNNLQFKFTRGSWETVEGDSNGQFIPNRNLEYTGEASTTELNILGWEDNGGGGNNSTASANTTILSTSFEIPQLNRTRRIWIYLPPDYETTDKTYPVMYMQDGQNLFDQTTSFAGEWGIDESLNELFENGNKGIIIVGIDHGGIHRIDEYSPWIHAQYGGGEGAAYVDFIVQTLKPYIDNHYRTKIDRLNTGIMGSSMGGLISFYAAIKYQGTFGKAGIFSPSFWFSDKVFKLVTETGKQADMKIYLLGGEPESGNLIQQLESMKTTLIEAGFSDTEVTLRTHPDGQHSEWYWAREFPQAYLWLFNEMNTQSTNSIHKATIKLSPNPISNTLQLTTDRPITGATARVYYISGQLALEKKIPHNQVISLKTLTSGIYLLEVIEKERIIFTAKIRKE